MTVFNIEFRETQESYWSREIEAETLEVAEVLFFSDIQGTEPDDITIQNTDLRSHPC